MEVLRDVLVQGVHEFPARVLAHDGQPAGHGEIAGARRGRVRHHDRVLVLGLGEIGPARGLGLLALLGLGGVEAHDREIGIHADPGVGCLAASEHRLQGGRIGRRIGLDHAHRGEQANARGREAPDDVGAGIVLLGDQLGRDHTGRIAHPGDLHRWVVGLEGLLERIELLVLDRGVDRELGLLREGRPAQPDRGQGHGAQNHGAPHGCNDCHFSPLFRSLPIISATRPP